MRKTFLNCHKDNTARSEYKAIYNKQLYNLLSMYHYIMRSGIVKLYQVVNYFHQHIFPSCYQNRITVTVICIFVS